MKLKKVLLTSLLFAATVGLAACASNGVTSDPSANPSGVVPTQSGESPTQTTTSEPQVIEYDENGEPVTLYQAQQLDLKASNGSAQGISDVDVNIDSITNGFVMEADDPSELSMGSGSVKTNGQINVLTVSGGYEQAYIEYNEFANASNYVISIKGPGYSDFTALNTTDEKYNKYVYNDFSGDNMRTDIFGLAEGTYRIRIVPVVNGALSNGTATECEVVVVKYDRSGYAHFNYTAGVGAYNDDGTMKANAKVIYVTDENKNTVELTQGDTTVRGIGNILNTVGQKCGESGHENECRKTSGGKVYYGTANSNADILNKLATADVPLIVRFVGCVSDSGLYRQGSFDASKASLIEGLTEYNTNNYGGSVGDNGHMARMKNAKNVTIEGVGENAVLDGWGIHFICEANPQNGKGTSFEVRNLAFMNTPEDALGMEGQQESAKGLTGAVGRCWIHHNCFLKPQIANPAESDKSEGDGSCDFKRGRYYTLSYNYFEYCHKTNLIGSSDDSLQFDISVHHNYWYNCGSRITLTRQANVHFYNNYNCCDPRDKDAELSYITSLRANCYIFSEANYFEGCKNVFQQKNGYAKCYNNSYVSCFGTLYGGGAVEVANREDVVSNSCKDGSTSLATFDTDPTLFYYDAANKKSDCYITSSATARNDCIKYAGSLYRTKGNLTKAKTNQPSSAYQAQNAVSVPTDDSELNIAMASSKGSSVVNNVYYNDVSGNTSSTCKFKYQGVTFRLTEGALVTVKFEGTAAGIYVGQLIRDDGKVMLNGSGSVALGAGHTYYITSTSMDKETTLSQLSFKKYDDANYAQMIVQAADEAYDAIPATLSVNLADYSAIAKAIALYNMVPQSSQASLSFTKAQLDAKLDSFVSGYKTYAEGLINEIGTVTESSASKINNANYARNVLKTISPSTEVSNYSTLTAAITAFEGFAINNCIAAINNIGAVESITLESFGTIQEAIKEYNTLTDENSSNDSTASQITNYDKLQAAIAKYVQLFNANAVNNMIISANKKDLNSIKEVIAAYNELSSDEKALITAPKKYGNILIANFELNYELLPTPSTAQASDLVYVNAVKEAYQLLTSEQKATLESKYNVVVALETTIKALGPETVATLNVTNFYDGKFEVTGATSSSGAVAGKVSKANSMTIVSNIAVDGINKLTLGVTTADKGSTTFNVYYSSNGETWTLIEAVKSSGNSGENTKTLTPNISGACFIKIEVTCTKEASNSKDASLTKLIVNA